MFTLSLNYNITTICILAMSSTGVQSDMNPKHCPPFPYFHFEAGVLDSPTAGF